jgi:hypothetical protein
MKKPGSGTAPSKVCAVELATSWDRWAKRRSDDELIEINQRIMELVQAFGKPHEHAGLGVRRLEGNAFEFRISRGLRVIFLFLKPLTLRMIMVGNHDDVRAWCKENL